MGLSGCRSVRNESVEGGGKECVKDGKYRNANRNQRRGEMYKLARKKSMKCSKKSGKESACVRTLGSKHYMCLFINVLVCFKPIIILFYHTRRTHSYSTVCDYHYLYVLFYNINYAQACVKHYSYCVLNIYI